MTTTTRLAAVLATVLAFAVPPSVGASSRPPAVTLRGSVTLAGSESYVRDVVLPRTTTFAEETWHTTWRIHAPRGRFAGFALRRAGTDDNQAAFAVTRGYCLTRACVRPAWVGAYGSGCICGGGAVPIGLLVLPAGRYRLHLIADGAPVTVTLTFPGLTGKVAIRAGSPHRTVIDTPQPAVLDPPIGPPAGMGGNRYSAGATHTAPHGGIYYLLAWKTFAVSPPKSVNQIGLCMFRGRATPGPLGLYQYPCDVLSAAQSVFLSGQVETGRTAGPSGALKEYVTFEEAFGVPSDGPGVVHEGTFSLGAYLNSHSPATEAHMQILWLDFAD